MPKFALYIVEVFCVLYKRMTLSTQASVLLSDFVCSTSLLPQWPNYIELFYVICMKNVRVSE